MLYTTIQLYAAYNKNGLLSRKTASLKACWSLKTTKCNNTPILSTNSACQQCTGTRRVKPTCTCCHHMTYLPCHSANRDRHDMAGDSRCQHTPPGLEVTSQVLRESTEPLWNHQTTVGNPAGWLGVSRIQTSLCGRDGRTICGPQCVPKSTCVSL